MTMPFTSSSDHPEQVGPYRILQILGEGGMGTVYEADQTEPIRRRVALKVMKAGMDSKEVVARFEAERQALAVMGHSGIARVFDAGTTPEGRPYFVMELVKGIPITDYCDQRKLTMRERLGLFVPVCEAVQHAHQKGIIHRDLKPSNIMVTEENGSAQPKIIDFGIAKATATRLTDKTLVTAYGMALGTPAYMSPEQAEMSGLDVDTRADIYSLGVLLYELLVGELPVDPASFGMHAFIAQLVLQDTETERPSHRMTTTRNAVRIAELRATDSGSLRKALKGDLDWIVLKAMEKNRARRYDTANGLAMDIERYLRNDPVVARPPTARYRFQKFARRNRVAVAAGAIVALALILGAVLATIGMVRATRAEQVAQREAATAREVADFLVSLFQVGDPSAAGGRHISAKELLDSGAVRIRTTLAERPLVQARLMETMGSAYIGLGQLDLAQKLLEEALAGLTAQGAPGTDVAHAQGLLAVVLVHQGDFEQSERLARAALATYREQFGEAYHEEAASATNALVFGFLRSGANLPEGEALLRTQLAQQLAAGSDGWYLADTKDLLCWVLLEKGDTSAAAGMCPDALALRRRLAGGDNIGVAVSLQRVGVVRRNQSRFDEALAAYREALAMNRRLYGDTHMELAYNHYDLSLTFRAMEQVDSALVHAREAARIRRDVLAGDNPQLAEALFELATVLRLRGDGPGAMQVWREAFQVSERALASQPVAPATVVGLMRQHARYAAFLRTQGRRAEAAAEDDQVIRLLDSARVEGLFGEGTPALTLNSACWLASLSGHGAEALPVCDAAAEVSDEGNRPRIRDSRGVARALAGDYAGAVEDFEAYIARPATASGVPLREAWVAALRRGENPFPRAELDRLIEQ
jgi:tetratricopeptide (TPR) repeat protein/tRNA A-37 threonylcarbamoyl transferase component Bud32